MKFIGWQGKLVCTLSLALLGATHAQGVELSQLIRERVAAALQSSSASSPRVDLSELRYFGTPDIHVGVKVSRRGRFESACMFKTVDRYQNVYFKYGEDCDPENDGKKEAHSRRYPDVELRRVPAEMLVKPLISEKEAKSAGLTPLACVAQQAQALDAVRKRRELSEYFRKTLKIDKVNFRVYDESSLKAEDAVELAEFRKSRTRWSGAEDARLEIQPWSRTLDLKVTLKSGSGCQYLDDVQLAKQFRADWDDRMRKVAEEKARQSMQTVDHAAKFKWNLAAFQAEIDQLKLKSGSSMSGVTRDPKQVDGFSRKRRVPVTQIKAREHDSDGSAASPLF